MPPGIKDLGPGDAVYGLTGFTRDGGAAEYIAVRAANLALKPRTIDHAHSAAVTLSGLTAWQALFTHGGLNRGQRVLIHAGAGGVGTFAVQLAHLKGAHVIPPRVTRMGCATSISFPTPSAATQWSVRGECCARFGEVDCGEYLSARAGARRFELGAQGHTRGKIVLQVRDEER